MPITIQKMKKELVVELEGSVTIRHAQEVAAKLGEALDSGAPLRVSTAALKDVDTSILQLLCSLRKSAPALSFENVSEEFIAAVDRCGLHRELLGGAREGA